MQLNGTFPKQKNSLFPKKVIKFSPQKHFPHQIWSESLLNIKNKIKFKQAKKCKINLTK